MKRWWSKRVQVDDKTVSLSLYMKNTNKQNAGAIVSDY